MPQVPVRLKSPANAEAEVILRNTKNGLDIDPDTNATGWCGERVDLDIALMGLFPWKKPEDDDIPCARPIQ